MAITDSLDAATAAVNALLAQIKVSTVRAVTVEDVGAADAYVFSPAPAVTAYGPDLLLLADIANPNQTTSPKLNLSGLGLVGITMSDGSAPPVGAVAGKCMLSFSSAQGGGYVARLESFNAATIAAAVAAALAAAGANYGVDSGAANAIVANVPSVTALTTGKKVMVKVLAGNTGSVVANISGLGNEPVYDANGFPLPPGYYQAANILGMVFDGTLQPPGWRIVDGAYAAFPGFSTPTNTASQAMNNTSLTALNPTTGAAAFTNIGTVSAAGVFTCTRPGDYKYTFDATLVETVVGANQVSGQINALHNGQFTAGGAPGDQNYASGSGGYAENLSIASNVYLAVGDTLSLEGRVTANSNFSSAACTSCGFSIWPTN